MKKREKLQTLLKKANEAFERWMQIREELRKALREAIQAQKELGEYFCSILRKEFPLCDYYAGLDYDKIKENELLILKAIEQDEIIEASKELGIDWGKIEICTDLEMVWNVLKNKAFLTSRKIWNEIPENITYVNWDLDISPKDWLKKLLEEED